MTRRFAWVAVFAVLSTGCPDTPTEQTTPAQPPTFNFIPDNTEACNLAKFPQFRGRARTALQGIATGTAYVATGLEVCPADVAANDPCGACADNPLRDLLVEADAASAAAGGPANLQAWFSQAMSYPLRELMVVMRSNDEGATTLTLAQGTPRACPTEAQCHDYRIRAESLEAECREPSNALAVSAADFDGLPGYTTEASLTPFTFLVPMVAELPPIPNQDAPVDWTAPGTTCPNAGEVQTTTDMARFLNCQNRWRVPVEEAVVHIRKRNGVQCGEMVGSLDPDLFPAEVTTLADVDAKTDNSGLVTVRLRFALTPAHLTVEE